MPDSDDPVGMKALVKVADKLIDAVTSGVGVVATPWRRKRDAQTDIDVEKIKLRGARDLQALRETLALPAETSDGFEIVEGEVVKGDASGPHVPALSERVRRRRSYQEAKRQLNVENIVREAATNVDGDEKTTPEPVDEDWIARFFADAQDVSNEQMQQLWGKILAGEVRRPGTFSLRALEVLRNLTQSEAKLLEKLAPFLVDEGCLLRPDTFEETGVQFEDWLGLVDAGLGQPEPLNYSVASLQTDRFEGYFRFGGVQVRVTRPKVTPAVTFSIYRLTSVGKELAALLPTALVRPYLLRITDRVKSMGCEVAAFAIMELRERLVVVDINQPIDLTADASPMPPVPTPVNA